MHGGGYVMGSVESHRCLLERLAVAVKGRVLALDYRLAPEVPFPAPGRGPNAKLIITR